MCVSSVPVLCVKAHHGGEGGGAQLLTEQHHGDCVGEGQDMCISEARPVCKRRGEAGMRDPAAGPAALWQLGCGGGTCVLAAYW